MLFNSEIKLSMTEVQNLEPELDLRIESLGHDTKSFSVQNGQIRIIDFTIDFTSAMGIEIEGVTGLKVTKRLQPLSTTNLCTVNLLQGARLKVNFQ